MKSLRHVALLAAAFGLAACGTHSAPPQASSVTTSSPAHEVTIKTTAQWSLSGQASHADGLCLTLTIPKGSGPAAAGCGFSDKASSDHYLVGGRDANRMVVFGPVRSAVVGVRVVAKGQAPAMATLIPLPASLGEGQVFVAETQPTDSVSVEPLDASGAVVDFGNF